MIDHLGIQVADMAASKEFYSGLLAPLGIRLVMDYDVAAGYAGPEDKPDFWLGQLPADRGPEEVHFAFVAPDRSAVDAVFASARALGAEVLHEPRVWPEYHPGYYAVFVRDLDGNNVEVVCHT